MIEKDKFNRLDEHNQVKSFKKFSSKDKEKIADHIEKHHEEGYLSPIVEDYVYATTRALDFGDYYGKQNKSAKWEHAVNKKADYFDFTELVEAVCEDTKKPRYSTFNKAHMYLNHNSSNVENSIGLVFDAIAVMDDYEDQHITVLFAIDKKREKRVARMLETYPTRLAVSMGCHIKSSICTVCGKEVISEYDLCNCLRFSRGQRIKGKKASELLIQPSFYELSVVNTPAAPTAWVIDSISKIIPGRLLKIASSKEGEELVHIMSSVYGMIKEAKTHKEKVILSERFDKLIYKLGNVK